MTEPSALVEILGTAGVTGVALVAAVSGFFWAIKKLVLTLESSAERFLGQVLEEIKQLRRDIAGHVIPPPEGPRTPKG